MGLLGSWNFSCFGWAAFHVGHHPAWCVFLMFFNLLFDMLFSIFFDVGCLVLPMSGAYIHYMSLLSFEEHQRMTLCHLQAPSWAWSDFVLGTGWFYVDQPSDLLNMSLQLALRPILAGRKFEFSCRSGGMFLPLSSSVLLFASWVLDHFT